MPTHLLDNMPWHSLSGVHARFSVGGDTARRYAPGFSPILGFANLAQPDWGALAAHCEPGEHLYMSGWAGTVPDGWAVDMDDRLHQLVWSGPGPAQSDFADAVPLGAEHVPQMLELVALTRPGPFGERTLELGHYVGVVEAGRLIAMAGERMAAGTLVEISAVCTRPECQGRGLARRLMELLIQRQLRAGALPFLHVMADNHRARDIYRRMGFQAHQELPLRVVSRKP